MSIDSDRVVNGAGSELERSSEMVRAVMASSHDGITAFAAVRDASGEIVDFTILDANEPACSMLGLPREALVGSTMLEVLPQRDETMFELCCAVVLSRQERHVVHRHSSGGSEYWLDTRASPLGDGLVTTTRDVTAERSVKLELRRRNTHDDLTGLPNRSTLTDHLRASLETVWRRGTQLAVMVIDLDRFKVINDALGHEMGDVLLRTIGERLSFEVRPDDQVIRLGGDSFVVTTVGLDPSSVAAVAERLLHAISAPVTLGGRTVTASASIGIAVTVRPEVEPSALVRDADVAMSRAKERAGNTWDFFDPELGDAARERLDVELDLGSGIQLGEFENHYQPLIEMTTGRTVGAETLVRWRHRTHGLLYPDSFIPAAEASGHVVPLGQQVLANAAAQMVAWRDTGAHDLLVIGVNSAPQELSSPTFARNVLDTLERMGVGSSELSIEITETAFMHDPDPALRSLEALSRAGVSIALDDFGTGFSSMTYLRDFPVDTIKVDRSFISTMEQREADRSLVAAIIAMARSLRKFTVAEGVENETQAAMLAEMGADFAQGYFFGRPVPPERF